MDGLTPTEGSPSLAAAFLLMLRDLLPVAAALPQTVDEILTLCGAGRSQAYAMLERLREHLPTLKRSPGRPALQASASTDRAAVLSEVLQYTWNNPGSVWGAGERRTYTDEFRAFMVALTESGQPAEGMTLRELASLCLIPLGTMKDWHRPMRERPATTTPEPSSEPAPGPVSSSDAESEPDRKLPDLKDLLPFVRVRATHIAVIVKGWEQWKGPFSAFCQMLRKEHLIPHGDTFIGNVLHCIGIRRRKRNVPVEAPWSSGTFRKLFPGAQWLGDGTSIAVRWLGRLFVFNVEAVLDVASGATVGIHVSRSEDEESLRLAYEMGCKATGAPPLCFSLDNKNSNHSPGTLEALNNTIILPSTLGRGQAKAPLEGSFGLFEHGMFPIVVEGGTTWDVARCVLELVMTAWFRGRNGRPRKNLGGKTPFEVYRDSRPTQEELDEAYEHIRGMQRRQEELRRTREARRDPVRLTILTEGLAELGIPDPDRRLAICLAYYSRDAIVYGLARFRAMLELGTLPPEADHGRYLGGIIRNRHTHYELELTAVYLLDQRIRLGDLTLEPLMRAAQQLRATTPRERLARVFVDRALSAGYELEFRFWFQAAAAALNDLPPLDKALQYLSLCKRIATAYKVDDERRYNLVDRLAQAAPQSASA